jgi:hypothetical protein
MAFTVNEPVIEQMNLYTMYVMLCSVRNATDDPEWGITTREELEEFWDDLCSDYGPDNEPVNGLGGLVEVAMSEEMAEMMGDFRLAVASMFIPDCRQLVNMDLVIQVVNNREGFKGWLSNMPSNIPNLTAALRDINSLE